MKSAINPSHAAASGSNPKSADLKLLAQSHGPEALLVLVRLMESRDEKVALAAAREVLLRAAGKPEQGGDEEGDRVIVIREKDIEEIN